MWLPEGWKRINHQGERWMRKLCDKLASDNYKQMIKQKKDLLTC